MFGKLLSLVGLGEDPVTVEAKRRMTRDHIDPARRFAFGLIEMKYEVDPAYLVEDSTTAVREWYGIDSRGALIERIYWYLQGADGTPGYDVFRAVFLARAGQAAGMLSEAESWAMAFEAARKVQRTFSSWRQYGMSYLEGHLAYRKREGDDDATLAEYRANLLAAMDDCERGTWALPFHTPL